MQPPAAAADRPAIRITATPNTDACQSIEKNILFFKLAEYELQLKISLNEAEIGQQISLTDGCK